MVFRFRMVISRLMMRCRMYFVSMAMVRWFGGSSIPFASLSAIDSGSMIASTQVFVEDCTIGAMESILLAISMTVVINLKLLQEYVQSARIKEITYLMCINCIDSNLQNSRLLDRHSVYLDKALSGNQIQYMIHE